MFTAEDFLNQTVEGAMATRIKPTPPGEYIATIAKLTPRETTKEGQTPCDVAMDIDDATLKAQLNRTRISSRMTVWLDFTPSGGLDNGEDKNTGLGKLREAVGQNDPTKPWSPSMLLGKPLRVKVTNEVDKKTGEIYDRVVQVAKL